MSVQMTSINAYYELKEEGKISERQELAFMTVRKFYEEKGYWPTPKEVHAFLAVEQGNEVAQFEGPNMVKPRITELLEDPGDDYPDLLEKKDESRKQEYIEDLLDEYESKKATPVKIAESVIDRTQSDDEGSGEDEDSVIVPEEELEESGEGVDDEDQEERGEDLDSGDVIFGGEDGEDHSTEDAEDNSGQASTEGSEEGETISIDGVEYEKKGDYWVSEDGQDYVFPPGKNGSDYDELDGHDTDDSSEDSVDENQETDQEKEQKEASLNQY